MTNSVPTAKVDFSENGTINNVHIYHDYKGYDYRPDGTLKQFYEAEPGIVPKITEYYADGKTVKSIQAKKPGGGPDDFEFVEHRDDDGQLLYQKLYDSNAAGEPRSIETEIFIILTRILSLNLYKKMQVTSIHMMTDVLQKTEKLCRN